MTLWRFTAAFLITVPSIATACSCRGPNFFHEAAKKSQVIVHARVIEYATYLEIGVRKIPTSIIVEVIHPIRHATKGERIVVSPLLLDCGPSVPYFTIGTDWILGLVEPIRDDLQHRNQTHRLSESFGLDIAESIGCKSTELV